METETLEKKKIQTVPKLRFREFEDIWSSKKLENLADVKGGKRIPKGFSLLDINNGFPYITVSDMQNGTVSLQNIKFVPIEVVQKISNYKIKTSDLFISVAGTLGIIGKIPKELENANLTENANKLTNLKCDQEFLFQYLQTNKLDRLIENVKTSNAQPKLAIYAIKSFIVNHPSLPEQQKIASFLSAVDKKIQQLNRKKELLETYKKGVMQQLFSQEIRFKDEDGKNFPEWEEKKLGALIKALKSGKTKSDDSGDINLYGSTGIIGKCKEISNEGTFILIARVGANAGQINLVTGQFGVTDNTLVLELIKGINQRYIFYFLHYFNLNKLIFGSGQPLITGGLLKKIKLTIPSKVEQQKIADFLTAIDKKIEAVSQQIEKTQSFKKGLLQQMFV